MKKRELPREAVVILTEAEQALIHIQHAIRWYDKIHPMPTDDQRIILGEILEAEDVLFGLEEVANRAAKRAEKRLK